jgi:UDP-N-acetylglucosamine 3-dehydrogenase
MRPKIVLIGAGRFGANHLRNLVNLDKKRKIDLIGVVDSDNKIVKNVKKNYGITVDKDYKIFIENADAFDLVTPAHTHYTITKNLLSKKKHVFVEKPLSLKSSESKELVKLSKKNNCVLQVGHIFRYNEAVEFIKKNIHLKENYPYLIKGKFLQTTEPKKDVGAIFNYLHHFDILDNILGMNPRKIFANSNLSLKKSDLEINSTVFLQYPKGVNAILELGWIPYGKYRHLELYSKKQYTFCDLEKQIINIYRNKKLIKTINFNFKEPLNLELNDFINSIKSSKTPKATGDVGLNIVKIAEAATKSIYKKKIITLQR